MKTSAIAELTIKAAGITESSPYFEPLVQTITETLQAERTAVRIENNRLRALWHDSKDVVAFSEQLNTLLGLAWGEKK